MKTDEACWIIMKCLPICTSPSAFEGSFVMFNVFFIIIIFTGRYEGEKRWQATIKNCTLQRCSVATNYCISVAIMKNIFFQCFDQTHSEIWRFSTVGSCSIVIRDLDYVVVIYVDSEVGPDKPSRSFLHWKLLFLLCFVNVWNNDSSPRDAVIQYPCTVPYSHAG